MLIGTSQGCWRMTSNRSSPNKEKVCRRHVGNRYTFGINYSGYIIRHTHGPRNLLGNRQRFFDGNRSLRNPLGQGRPFHQLHHQGATFSATLRPSRLSWERYASPIALTPSSDRISKGPSLEPAAKLGADNVRVADGPGTGSMTAKRSQELAPQGLRWPLCSFKRQPHGCSILGEGCARRLG
jgi:hypothetical protein